MLASHSKFPSSANGEFLSATQVLAALNTIESSYSKREFRGEARKFLEENTNSVFSNVAVRSNTGQGFELFLPRNRNWWGRQRPASSAWSVA